MFPESMRSIGRGASTVCCLLAAAFAPVSAQDRVRVWEGTMVLPTYREGLPDRNPPFDFFEPQRVNYPYTLRTNLTNEREDHEWRALFLENRYLRCSVLPDLGGHLYSCTDKLSGEEMFYANPSIKLSQIGYRGAWAALGIEFNYPVSHNWLSTSPVDFAAVENADGSASVWVANTDRVFGTRWRVELELHPGRASLEQHTILYNPGAFRHRYYWWTNAAVEVWDDSRILYPQRFTASHGFTDVDTWPVDRTGTDNSVLANQVYGPVSRFSHGSREPFMAVYHPRTETGTVHWSDPSDLPAKKFWSWGVDARAMAWRRALSDDNSAYVEIQAGLFRNQETYEFMAPEAEVEFSETWLPIRGLGGVTRATPDAVAHLERSGRAGSLRLRMNVAVVVPEATLTLIARGDTVVRETVALDPAETVDRTFATIPEPATLHVRDASGRTLLTHTEGVFDYLPDSLIQTGPQEGWSPPDERDSWTAGDYLAVGEDQERDGRRLRALRTYEDGLNRFPDRDQLLLRSGALLSALDRPDEAIAPLGRVLERVSTDAEAWYHLGQARLALADDAGARLAFEQAQLTPAFRVPALIELAAIGARTGSMERALNHLEQAVDEAGGSLRARWAQVALLRAAGRAGEARALLDEARALDPVYSGLRHEAARLGADNSDLLAHLAGDPERVLELVRFYIGLGMVNDATELLDADYPNDERVVAEPGQPRPDDYPLLHYYAAWLADSEGRSPESHLQAARHSSAEFVFPNHRWDRRVMEWALRRDPADALALHLLASLRLASGLPDQALSLWDRARAADPTIPALHRNMGRTVLASGGDPELAVEYLRQGLEHDARNVDVYIALDTALVLSGRPAQERADAVLAYPDLESAPAGYIYHAARVLSQVDQHDRAAALFSDRFFPSEEGGTDPRVVYLSVQRARTRALSTAGDCETLERVVQDVEHPGERLSFADARYFELLDTDDFSEMGDAAAQCRNRDP